MWRPSRWESFRSGAGAHLALSAIPGSSWTNANDRLPGAPLGRVESSDSLVKRRDTADMRPQSSIPHAPDDLTQLRTARLDNAGNRSPAVSWLMSLLGLPRLVQESGPSAALGIVQQQLERVPWMCREPAPTISSDRNPTEPHGTNKPK